MSGSLDQHCDSVGVMQSSIVNSALNAEITTCIESGILNSLLRLYLAMHEIVYHVVSPRELGNFAVSMKPEER